MVCNRRGGLPIGHRKLNKPPPSTGSTTVTASSRGGGGRDPSEEGGSQTRGSGSGSTILSTLAEALRGLLVGGSSRSRGAAKKATPRSKTRRASKAAEGEQRTGKPPAIIKRRAINLARKGVIRRTFSRKNAAAVERACHAEFFSGRLHLENGTVHDCKQSACKVRQKTLPHRIFICEKELESRREKHRRLVDIQESEAGELEKLQLRLKARFEAELGREEEEEGEQSLGDLHLNKKVDCDHILSADEVYNSRVLEAAASEVEKMWHTGSAPMQCMEGTIPTLHGMEVHTKVGGCMNSEI